MEVKTHKYIRGKVKKKTVFEENKGSLLLYGDARFFKSNYMDKFEAINEGDEIIIKYNESRDVTHDKTYYWISNVDYVSSVDKYELENIPAAGESKTEKPKGPVKEDAAYKDFTNGSKTKSREEAEDRASDDNLRVATKLKEKFEVNFGELNESNTSIFNTILINTFHKLR